MLSNASRVAYLPTDEGHATNRNGIQAQHDRPAEQ